MKHTRLLLIVSLTILTSAFQIGAMNKLSKVPRPLAKKYFSKVMTVVGLSIAGGSMVRASISNAGSIARINRTPDEFFNKKYGRVPFLVKSLLKKTTGNNNLRVVKITVSSDVSKTPIAIYGNRVIMFEPSFVPSLEDVLHSQDPIAEAQDRNMYRFLIHKKYNQKNDTYRLIAAKCSIPVLTCCGFLLTLRGARSLILPKSKPTSGIRWFSKELGGKPLLGCLGKVINYLLHIKYMKYLEQKANDKVPDEIDILKGGIRFYDEETKYLAATDKLYKEYENSITEKLIKRFESRIKNLKQQESS